MLYKVWGAQIVNVCCQAQLRRDGACQHVVIEAPADMIMLLVSALKHLANHQLAHPL